MGVLGGGLLPYIHRAITNFAPTGIGGLFGLLLVLVGVWVLLLVTSWLLGALIGGLVGLGATSGKSRDTATGGLIGFISGVAACVAYVVVRNQIVGVEAFDSMIDVIRTGVNFLVIVITAPIFVGKAIMGQPFCEACEEYMTSIIFEKIPIQNEKNLMAIFESRAFENLATLISGPK